MAPIVIGTTVGGRTSGAALVDARAKEAAGYSAIWFTGGSGPDPVGLAVAAAAQLTRARIGTAIASLWSMSPVTMALQGQVAAQLSGSRFRLGIGVASPQGAARYGATYARPLAHLREYVTIIRTLLTQGEVDFTGHHYRVTARLAEPTPMPVMVAALGERAFTLAGEVADGAISWVTPAAYLRDVARPALERGAARAGRPAPPIIAHVPVAVTTDRQRVREAFRQQFSFYVRAPHYQAMFVAAGFPEARAGSWSDAMIDALVLSGSEAEVEHQLEEVAAIAQGELFVSPLAGVETERTISLLTRLAAA